MIVGHGIGESRIEVECKSFVSRFLHAVGKIGKSFPNLPFGRPIDDVGKTLDLRKKKAEVSIVEFGIPRFYGIIHFRKGGKSSERKGFQRFIGKAALFVVRCKLKIRFKRRIIFGAKKRKKFFHCARFIVLYDEHKRPFEAFIFK